MKKFLAIIFCAVLIFPNILFSQNEIAFKDVVDLDNIIVAPLDTLVGTFVWCWDDGDTELYDSLTVYKNHSIYSGIEQKATMFSIPWQTLHGDTNSFLSIAKLRSLQNHGWEIGSHTYRHAASMYNGTTGKVATGNYTSMNDFENDITMAIGALVDTIQVGYPKSFSYPYSAAFTRYEQIVSNYHDCAMSGKTRASTASGQGLRYNRIYNVFASNEGVAGWGAFNIAAYPGLVHTPYQIAQTISEGDAYGIFRRNVLHAVETKGLCIFAGHKPSNMPQPFYVYVRFIDSLVAAGRLQVSTFYNAYKKYWLTPISPSANFIDPNFHDAYQEHVNTSPDMMYFTNGSFPLINVYRDSIPGVAVNPGHGAGNGYATLNFTDATVTASNAERYCQWVIPVSPWDGVLYFECFVQVDPSIQTDFRNHQAGKYVAVVFKQTIYSNWNAFSRTYDAQPGQTNSRVFSSELVGDTLRSEAGNKVEFVAADTVGGKWTHLIAFTPINGLSDKVQIQIVPQRDFLANAVRISDVSVRKIQRQSLPLFQRRLY